MAFSPIGYTPLLSLVDACQKSALSEGDHLGLFRSLKKHTSPEFLDWLLWYHPRESIVESVALEVAYKSGLFACSPSGAIMKLDTPFHLIDENIHSCISSFTEEDVTSTCKNESFFDCISFHNACVEVSEKEKNEQQLDRISKLWFRGNNRVPLFYNRYTYILSNEVFDTLERLSFDPSFPAGQGWGAIHEVSKALSGHSLCIKDESNFSELVDIVCEASFVLFNCRLGADISEFREYMAKIPNVGNSTESQAKGKRGSKPTGAKQEFFRRYPDGKPEGLSSEAIAAELTEAGFTICGRSVQNYAKEIKNK